MKTKKKRVKKPSKLKWGWGYATTQIAPPNFTYEGKPVAEVLGHYWFDHKDCLKLAKWLTQASEYLKQERGG